jgi:hypothetical protein
MSNCDNCGTMILFGGVRNGGYHFCKPECHNAAAHLFTAASQLPHEFILEQATQLHGGACPKCHGPGPIDIQWKHSVWSAVVLTQWRSTPMVCCDSCATKGKLSAIATSTLFGWWGMPFGLLLTPIQIIRNVVALFTTNDPAGPSDALVQLVRRNLAAQLLAEDRRRAAAAA